MMATISAVPDVPDSLAVPVCEHCYSTDHVGQIAFGMRLCNTCIREARRQGRRPRLPACGCAPGESICRDALSLVRRLHRTEDLVMESNDPDRWGRLASAYANMLRALHLHQAGWSS